MADQSDCGIGSKLTPNRNQRTYRIFWTSADTDRHRHVGAGHMHTSPDITLDRNNDPASAGPRRMLVIARVLAEATFWVYRYP